MIKNELQAEHNTAARQCALQTKSRLCALDINNHLTKFPFHPAPSGLLGEGDGVGMGADARELERKGQRLSILDFCCQRSLPAKILYTKIAQSSQPTTIKN